MKIRIITLIGIVILVGLINQTVTAQVLTEETFKVGRTLSLIDANYVDSVNVSKLAEDMIISTLKKLDPHSTYISAKDVKEMNEPLIGNFEGIGVQFDILHDTIIIVEPITGGPSEKVGIRAGDRIVTINGEKVTNIGMSTSGVYSRLRGAKGTIVNITIFRKGEKEVLDFTITRDKIPIFSLVAAYMLDGATGYIKLDKFAATTEKEFQEALVKLQKSKVKNLVIDLRSNGGGYMLAATDLANHFFADQRLLVYLIGRKTPRQDFKSAGSGDLANARLVVLTDENSASASEIFAGAIQDWDRGVIIGRRTFGKGLVQNGYYLTDGSMIRLTIARYYTPTGRSIQTSYKDGYDKYMKDFLSRYSKGGEIYSADSIPLPDTLKYKTLVSNRIVHGGGGIIPDVFVAQDTSYLSDYYRALYRKDIFRSFVSEYADINRARITSEYKTFDDFKVRFKFTSDELRSFIKKGEDAGVKYNESQYRHSEEEMLLILKALVASRIWQTNEYFRIINENDTVIEKALQVINDGTTYNKILGYQR
ncbi:MAG: S41 family peptidase [Bacteroidia bacterium]|nr:S41 family peptidase [Bacteroidia bacterium]